MAPGGDRGDSSFLPGQKSGGPGPPGGASRLFPNLATADPTLYALSTERLFRELDLARALQADYLVAHPGHGPLEEASFAQVARALAQAVSRVPPPPLVLLENTAGQGQELGWRFEHLKRIITAERRAPGVVPGYGPCPWGRV